MSECIDGYVDGQLSLQKLVSSMEGLIAALEDVTPAERDKLLRMWAGLEKVLASGLDQGRPNPDAHDKELISQTLSELSGKVSGRGDR